MASIAVRPDDVIVGVDTHKDNHVAVAITGLGARIEELSFPATNTGYHQMTAWARALGPVAVVGLEGSSSYGKGLNRHLNTEQIPTLEISRPPRAGTRRSHGKNDSIDAEAAARQVLAGTSKAVPKTGDGPVEALRVLKIARDGAVKAHTQAMVTIRSVLITADDNLRQQLAGKSPKALAVACVALKTADPSDPAAATHQALASIAQRWLVLDTEIKNLDKPIKELVSTLAPQLLEQPGIGPQSASQLLITLGDNLDRVRTDAQFARLCGACPIPAGSGQTNNRHRLNRGGDRQANAALHRIVIVRMRTHQPTKDYIAERIALGKTKKEATRCLKRYTARQVFKLLTKHPLDI